MGAASVSGSGGHPDGSLGSVSNLGTRVGRRDGRGGAGSMSEGRQRRAPRRLPRGNRAAGASCARRRGPRRIRTPRRDRTARRSPPRTLGGRWPGLRGRGTTQPPGSDGGEGDAVPGRDASDGSDGPRKWSWMGPYGGGVTGALTCRNASGSSHRPPAPLTPDGRFPGMESGPPAGTGDKTVEERPGPQGAP